MPAIRHPEWRAELEAVKYPFSQTATLSNAAGDVIFETTFLDATFYVVGAGPELYLSKVTVTSEEITLFIGDRKEAELASGTFDRANPPDELRFVDVYGRPAGLVVSESIRLALFSAWDIGDHEFTPEQTAFVARCCHAVPLVGLRGFELDDGNIVSDDVWLVGDDGVVLTCETVLEDGECGEDPTEVQVIRVDIVGDPLFRRRLCSQPDAFETPHFLQTLTFCSPGLLESLSSSTSIESSYFSSSTVSESSSDIPCCINIETTIQGGLTNSIFIWRKRPSSTTEYDLGLSYHYDGGGGHTEGSGTLTAGWTSADGTALLSTAGYPHIGAGNVVVRRSPTSFEIEFIGALAGLDLRVPYPIYDYNSPFDWTESGTPSFWENDPTYGAISPYSGFYKPGIKQVGGVLRNEKQTITFDTAPGGGTFTLTFSGDTTAAISYNATAGDVQSALEALPSIGSGNVSVTGGPGPGTPWTVEFTGTLGLMDVEEMTADCSLLTFDTPCFVGGTVSGGESGFVTTEHTKVTVFSSTDNKCAKCGPGQYGDVKIFAHTHAAPDTILRIRPVQQGLRIETVGERLQDIR